MLRILNLALLAGAAYANSASTPLVSSPGQSAVIPGWNFRSMSKAGDDISKLSQQSFDVSSWYSMGSRGTVMAGLLENGVYNDSQLFFSDNLEKIINYAEYAQPFYFRNDFSLTVIEGQHYVLQTNGITSKADIYLNGIKIADKTQQAGTYGGMIYDVTTATKNSTNVLLIKVYPTSYDLDFAQGFVDWNPYPPDNGSGIWRDIQFRQSEYVMLSPPRIVTNFKKPGASSVDVMVRIDVQNLASSGTMGMLKGFISGDHSVKVTLPSQAFQLGPGEKQTIALTAELPNPKVWWPHQWGDQPLYKTQVQAIVNEKLSDVSEERTFGIRHVSSHVNEHNDTIFEVNGQPFQVLGGGYSPDIFLRVDLAKLTAQLEYVVDMGLNTLRLEGKMEHPELYDLADEMGIMVIPGWECCDKWEAWTYNDEITAPLGWSDQDYHIANRSMRHEATMLQSHPSVLGYLVGSDYWPNDRAASMYVDALHDLDWNAPIIASAAKRSYPEILGPSGMKMDGPYDWVPPNYWYNDRLGAAFGFGSELGAGVGTPEIGSLKRFLSESNMEDLWKSPKKGLYHMSTNVSSFHDRSIYDDALFHRYGKPTSLDDYLLKAQMMDYEATRAEFEGFSAMWSAERPATGAIYWMLNNAWPSLHWNLMDYYLHPSASYFGTKVGSRIEHVAYDYNRSAVYLINHSLDQQGPRTVEWQILSLNGTPTAGNSILRHTQPNTSKKIGNITGLDKIEDVTFLRLMLFGPDNATLSRNVYWLTPKPDVMDWDNSTWYNTPVTSYADFTALEALQPVTLTVQAGPPSHAGSKTQVNIALKNKSEVPAVFIRMNLVDQEGQDVVPVIWSDNYMTLWPGEKVDIVLQTLGKGQPARRIEVTGRNLAFPLSVPMQC